MRAVLYMCAMIMPATMIMLARSDDPAMNGLIAALMIGAVVGLVLLLFATVTRWHLAVVLAPEGSPTSLLAAQRIARRQRTAALLVMAACAAAACASPWTIVGVFWVPVLVGPLAWRAERAARADEATAVENIVHLWRDGELRSWLRVRPRQLAELAVPEARVTRRRA